MFLSNLFGSTRIVDIAPPVPFEELKKRVKIVVVDDDADSFPTEALRENGYTIDWWPSLDPARLHRLEAGAFDIVVLDIQGITSAQLSGTGDGLGVLKRIKDVNPRQIVVAFSGKAYDLGSMPFYRVADDTMAKPVNVIQCKEVLDHLIEERISVPQYWTTIERLLEREGVPERRIRKLEKMLVKRVQKNQAFTMDDVKRVVGHIETAATIFSVAQQLVGLCRILIGP